MANLRIKGDTSGYVDLVAPDVAGSTTIELNKLLVTDASGNVGIGNISPSYKLDVSGEARFTSGARLGSENLRLSTDGNGELGLGYGTSYSASSKRLSVYDNTNLQFSVYNSGHMYIKRDDGVLDFDQGIKIQTNASNGDSERGGGITFRNYDVETAGVYGIRQGGWASALAFYTHTSGAGNTFGTTFTEKMRINASGHVTTPSQPGFAAVRNSTYNYSGGTGYTTISGWYNSTARQSFNIGNHFNYSTGVFTAPVTGKYTFKFQVLLQSVASGDDSIHVAFYTNGSISQYGNIRAPGISADYVGYGAYLPVIGSTDLYLSESDTVDLRMSSSGNIDVYGGQDWSRFSGYLIG